MRVLLGLVFGGVSIAGLGFALSSCGSTNQCSGFDCNANTPDGSTGDESIVDLDAPDPFGDTGPGKDSSNCSVGCSGDLHNVVDCNGNVVLACPPDKGCAPGGTCVDACDAAKQNKSSVGCEYFALSATDFTGQTCFAAFVANTWGSPVTVAVERGGAPLTGIAYAPDGMLLVVDAGAVVRVHPVSGEKLGTLVPAGAGGVDGPTIIAVVPIPDVPEGTAEAVEYHHAGLDHYFLSLIPGEIAALDAGTLPGWTRTGLTFRGWAVPGPGTSPVCRFYLPPAAGNSHFFSADPAECARLRDAHPDFVPEGEPFHIALPDPVTGACPAATAPVYRFWNARAGDTNHRYTTSLQVAREMTSLGHVAEGYGPGPDFPIMCEVR